MKKLHLSLFIFSYFIASAPNGYAVAGTDPHSFAEPTKIVTTHLNLDLKTDFAVKRLSGSATLTVRNLVGTQILVLDTSELEISKVLIGEKQKGEEETSFSFGKEDSILGTPLLIKIRTGTKFVTVFYRTSPQAKALGWMESKLSASGKTPFLYNLSEPHLGRSWIPCQDTPGVRITFRARVKVPAGLMAVMTGLNPTTQSPNGEYEFSMPQPIPSYLISLAVGDLTFKSVGPRTGVYAEPSMIEAAVKEFSDLEKMVHVAEDGFGPYLWERFDVLVLPKSFPYWGMENPRLSFLSSSVVAGDKSALSTVVHELSHSWSGNLVTNATWNDFWLNEGFTRYLERRNLENLYGRELSELKALQGLVLLQKTVEEMNKKTPGDARLFLDLTGRDPDDGYTPVAYEKGYFFLRHIEETIGRTPMDTFLKKYFHEHQFQSMTTAGFLEYFRKQVVKGDPDLERKLALEEWIYGRGIPASIPKVKSKLLDVIDGAVQDWKNGKSARAIAAQNHWDSVQASIFLEKLPLQIASGRMEELDQAFAFSKSRNVRFITVAWLRRVIWSKYSAAYPLLREVTKNWAMSVPYRKQLYQALIESDQRAEAEQLFQEAREDYHPLTVRAISNLLSAQR